MNLFIPNMGRIDRILRFALGAGLIGWGLYAQNWWGALGLLPLLTATLNSCPAYTLLGVKTSATKQA